MRRIAIVATALLMCVGAYCAIVVVQAWRATPSILTAALDAESVELEIGDFQAGWLEDLLAVEDPNFYQHSGVDLTTPGAGITTITQGLVKQLYFSEFRPGLAKLRQTLIAWLVFDRLVDKPTQLRLFVNRVYLGRDRGQPVHGFALAAQAYFGRPFSELSREEFHSLVAMIIAPAAFHVRDSSASNARRVSRIEDVLEGSYQPAGLMDVYYGSLTLVEQETIPPFSYFGS